MTEYRNTLAPFVGKRIQCYGAVTNFGQVRGADKKNILIRNIYDSNKKFLCNHIWIDMDNNEQDFLKIGDFISFTAKVKKYTKKYKNIDIPAYKLCHIQVIKVLNNED